jgi:hypothetical protein
LLFLPFLSLLTASLMTACHSRHNENGTSR